MLLRDVKIVANDFAGSWVDRRGSKMRTVRYQACLRYLPR